METSALIAKYFAAGNEVTQCPPAAAYTYKPRTRDAEHITGLRRAWKVTTGRKLIERLKEATAKEVKQDIIEARLKLIAHMEESK